LECFFEAGTILMWKTWSLRTRLCIFLCAMFLTALIAGLVLLRVFAAEQLADENEPAGRSSILIAGALNKALAAASNPEATLAAFVGELNTPGTDSIKFRASPQSGPDNPATVRTRRVPAWFVHVLALPDPARHTPIMIRGERVGELVFETDMATDIYEKWIGFVAIVTAGAALTFFTLVITYLTVDAALRPLRDLGNGLVRLRDGQYSEKIPCSGPPEIAESCEAANDLATTLTQLNRENRSLLRKMVSIQDEERRDIARELHDELGPLLFAIRANVIAMVDSGAADQSDLDSPAQKALQSVEALQSTNRRILDRLRPMHIEELGLQSSIQKLLRGIRSQVPAIDVAFEIDPGLDAIDAVVSQTVYRVLQEGITNVLRHAQATEMRLRASLSDGKVVVEIYDNGVGMPANVVMGRGLTGMRERVRALGGTFELSGSDGRTCVRCSLPFAPAELETG
jgi:two-component system, NarL family, sensor histidine kinase UhpB